MTGSPANGADRVREQLERWRQDLIDLTLNNPLLNFRETRTSNLVLKQPSPSEVLAGLGGRAARQWFFWEPPVEDATEPPSPPRPVDIVTSKNDPKQLASTLTNIARATNKEFLDRGLWTLYLGVGLLHWSDTEIDRYELLSPVVLVPVELYRPSPRERFKLCRQEEDVVVNPALAVKLAEDFGIELPQRDLDVDEIPEFLAAERQKLRLPSGWSLDDASVLGRFSFHKQVMFRDLQEHAASVLAHPHVQALALGPGAPAELDFAFDPVPVDELDDAAPPEDMVTILDADSSQRQSILAARSGHTFVMDGPPDSGKSQTIANIVAELLAAGRTVLFVSEKAAALEIVHSRLADRGLGDFVLELHSHKATRKGAAQVLGKALQGVPVVPPLLSAMDRDRLADRRIELSRFASAMNERREALGRSLHDVLGRLAQLEALPRPPVPGIVDAGLNDSELAAMLDQGEALSLAWGPVARGDDFLWRDLSGDRPGKQDRRVLDRLDALDSALTQLTARVDAAASATGIGWSRSVTEAVRLHELLVCLGDPAAAHMAPAWLSIENLDGVANVVADRRRISESHAGAARLLQEVVGPGAANLDPATARAALAATASLAELPVPLGIAGSCQRQHVEGLRAFLAATPARLDYVARHLARVAAAFGLSSGPMNVGRSREIAQLGLLTASAHAPEAAWLNPLVLQVLQEAERVLQTLVEEFQQRRDDLLELFTDEVLSRDLEGLCVRFSTVHTGLHKLGGAYRADKKAVAACTRSQKCGAAEIARLPEALAWQRLVRRLTEAESRHAAVIGTFYYQRETTDFAALVEAIEVARRGLELAGPRADPGALSNRLARGVSRDPSIYQSAVEAARVLGEWYKSATAWMAPHQVGSLTALPLQTIAVWASSAVPAVDAIVRGIDIASWAAQRRLDFAAVRAACSARVTIEEAGAALSATAQADASLLGPAHRGVETDWSALETGLACGQATRAVLGRPLDQQRAQHLLQATVPPEPLKGAIDSWTKATDAFAGCFVPARASKLVADLDVSFEDGKSLLADLRATLGDIDEWDAYARARSALDARGLGPVVEFCTAQRVAKDEVKQVIERAVLDRWAECVLAEDDRLVNARSEARDSYVEEFRRLDRALVDGATARVVAACVARRPKTGVGGPGVIQTEAAKKTRHMPIRTLLAKAGTTAQALKPCFMMSPLTVSQFLPDTLHFDAVIFDEASQVRPCDAVNAIYRADQVIIAGDQKQLPPTAFFDRATAADGEDYEEEELAQFESVLDLAKRGCFASLPLRWHYRSRHESLITYSNYSFYDGGLITFPSAVDDSPDLGIKLIKVNGVYRRGGANDNPIEAEAVVDRVFEHARAHPKRTLGVVAFSLPQAGCIETALEARRRDHPELDEFFSGGRLDGVFVKNLESVQGDERDTIIISVGYGPDEAGKFTMNFGPLQKRGGERRLNVLITRARRRIEIVTSVTHEQFRPSQRQSGARHLQGYLEFAERGVSALAGAIGPQGGAAESPFEEEVLRVVRSWGWEAVPQVGVAGYRLDIGVRHPDKPGVFAIGIECDGAMYHSSRVARDRDRLRQEVLEGLGWHLHRIWGPAWHRQRRSEEQRLREAFDRAVAGAST